MKILFGIIIVGALSFGVFGQEDSYVKEEVVIDGRYYTLLENSVAELRKHNLEINKYKIALYRYSATTFLILFSDPNSSSLENTISSKSTPNFEVVLDIEGRVVRSNFSR